MARPAVRRSGATVVGLSLACLLGPALLQVCRGDTFAQQDLAQGATPPSLRHFFGTDFYGRDLLVRVLVGGQISLATGLFGAAVAACVGTLYGACAGYAGGRIDNIMMRVVDVIDALPYMFLVIVLVTVFGKSLWLLFAALGLVGWLMTARIVRGQILALKGREFVQAARALGAGPARIIGYHLLPNTLSAVIISFTLAVPAMIMQEAFLSFLGLGVQAPRPSLGSLINEGAADATLFWWELFFPAALMALLLYCLNILGDGLRDSLDPKAQGGPR
jgi:oligopeptide transport system permease protein